jgi:lipoate-protein ligase A
MVRKVNIDVGAGEWGAVASLMRKEIHEGTFEPTVALLNYRDDMDAFGPGVYEDADLYDFDLLEEKGYTVGRRLLFGGGTAMHIPQTPVISVFYQNEDGTLKKESDIGGEANARALQRFGLDAVYRPIGDTEIDIDGDSLKIMASSSGTMDLPGFWGITVSIIWDAPPEDVTEVFEQAYNLPPEKFEDKDTDSATSRIRPISSIAEEQGIDITKEELIDAVVEENVNGIFGEDEEIVEEELRPEEQEYMEKMTPFFESDAWVKRVSTSRMLRQVPQDYDVGVAAFKARKLIKASVVFNEHGDIYKVLYSGDEYIRPQPTPTEDGVMKEFSKALRGMDPTDEAALTEAIENIYERENVEAPGIQPEHFVQPVLRAANNKQSIESYLEEYN